MTKETVDKNCEYLTGICGLFVRVMKDKKGNVYSFYPSESKRIMIKRAYTYPKAKLFAEGVKWGRLTS